MWDMRALKHMVRVSKCLCIGTCRGLRHPKAQVQGQSPTAAAVPPESLGNRPHAQYQLCILSQILPSPSITFIWKFVAKTVQGCRMEVGSAPHSQAGLEVGFNIPPSQNLSQIRARGRGIVL